VLRGHEAFVIGAIAKALATVITYPLQLAQVKMRASARLLDKVTRMYYNCHPDVGLRVLFLINLVSLAEYLLEQLIAQ
jgi:hypothetical protein